MGRDCVKGEPANFDSEWSDLMATTYFNGKYLVGEEIALPAIGHPWLRGDCAFETLRTEGSTIYFLQRHLRRLNESIASMGFESADQYEIEYVARKLMAQSSNSDIGRLRITCFSNGDLLITHESAKSASTNIKIGIYPIVRPSTTQLIHAKNGSYAAPASALRWAHKEGYDDVLFVNEKGNIAEATFANVGFVIDGELLTPTLDSGCLPGIVRQVALEIVPNFREADISREQGLQAESVFTLSSIREIQFAESIAGRKLKVGRLLTDLRDAFLTHAQANPNS